MEPPNFQTFSTNSIKDLFTPPINLIVITTPYSQLSLSAALKSCSAAEEEASILLGATPTERVRLLVWPHVKAPLNFHFNRISIRNLRFWVCRSGSSGSDLATV